MGVAVCEGEVFVADYRRCVIVFRVDSGAFVRRIGNGWLRSPRDVCVRGGLLFVTAASDASSCAVFSVADGSHVADLVGMTPRSFPVARGRNSILWLGVCTSDDGVLYVTSDHGIVSLRVFGEGDAEAPSPWPPGAD